jgi:hypothetical protein
LDVDRLQDAKWYVNEIMSALLELQEQQLFSVGDNGSRSFFALRGESHSGDPHDGVRRTNGSPRLSRRAGRRAYCVYESIFKVVGRTVTTFKYVGIRSD